MNKKASNILKKMTIELLVETGVDKVSMDQIAQYCKTSKATIYKYFEDKSNLYYAVGKYVMEEKVKEYKSIVSEDVNLINKLENYISAVSQFSDCGYFKLCNHLIKHNVGVKKVYEEYKRANQSIIIELIRDGLDQNILKHDLSEEMIFSYINMGIQYYQFNDVYRFRMNNDVNYQEKYMRFLLSNIFTDQFMEEYRGYGQ